MTFQMVVSLWGTKIDLVDVNEINSTEQSRKKNQSDGEAKGDSLFLL